MRSLIRGRPPGAVSSKPPLGKGLLESVQTPDNPMPFIGAVKPPLGAVPSVGGGLGRHMMRAPGSPRARNMR